jgi:transposase
VLRGYEISFLKRELGPKKKNYDMSVDKRPSYFIVKNWVARFRTGHLRSEDEERSGRPTQVAIPENMDAIHSMILDDRRISVKKTAEIPKKELAILLTRY